MKIEGEGIATSTFEDLYVITLRGEWDVATRDRLRGVLQEAGTANDVLVDLRQASFFDSTALAELIALYKRLNGAGRRLEALVGDSNMRRLLQLTSLDALLGISPERARYLSASLPETVWPEG
ncbi:MAG TPA: STAS domain-containing protein [Candidatus Cybelea sp.]|jgi:anti-anti-sigma factor|nr:STAS domain-containing protein [Candidatus Cybelea sp.]